MNKIFKKILKITGILFLVLIIILIGVLFYQRHTVFAFYYLKTNQNGKALPHLAKIVKDTDDLNYRLWRFLLLYPHIDDKNKNKEICEMVISDCNKILKPQPDDEYYIRARNNAEAVMHYHQSMSYFLNGEYEKSADEYMMAYNAKAACPPYGDLVNNAPCFIYMVKPEDIEKVVSYYTILIRKYPETEFAYYFRGKIYLDKGNYEEALEDFNKAIELCPQPKTECFSQFSPADFYLKKAEICEKLGRNDEAIKAYKGYIKYDPTSYLGIISIEESKERIKALGG